MQRTILEATIEVFDPSHDPSHLCLTLQREVPTNLHLQASPRTTPGTSLCQSSVDDHLVQIIEATEIGEVPQGFSRGEGREIEAEVSTWSDVDGLEDAFSFDAIHGLETSSVVSGDGATRVALQNIRSDARGDSCEVGESIHVAVDIIPGGSNSSDAERSGCIKPRTLKAISLVEYHRSIWVIGREGDKKSL